MKKILKIVGLVVLTLVVLLALVIVFVPIDGYTILQRIQSIRELNKPLSPNYTAKSYQFKSDGTVDDSNKASSKVDIKLNGSDRPLKVTLLPASYTLSWTVDKSLLDGTYDCIVYGKDETGVFAEKTATAFGEWKITGVAFTRDRVPGEKNPYTVSCENGHVIEMDTVEVWFTEETGQ